MRVRKSLWLLDFDVPAEYADFFADALSENVAALSVTSPPRQARAHIEAIYDVEPQDGLVAAQLAILAVAVGMPTPSFVLKLAPNLDWLKKVAGDFPPVQIARWTVHGACHRAKVPNRLNALQIDATSAFGTGEHPTTRGCLLMLDRLLTAGFKPERMADIGCGSGILSMAYAQVVRGQAVAVDLDPDSVQIAASNARHNGLGRHIRVGLGNGYRSPLIRGAAPFDLIMANIFAGPLCRMAKDLKAHLRPGGIAVLSGLLTSQSKSVIAAHRLQGLSLINHMTLGEWSVLALRR